MQQIRIWFAFSIIQAFHIPGKFGLKSKSENMKSEKEFILLISKNLPRSKRQINKLFESDSEIIIGNKGNLLFTVDDYSDEDRFQTQYPYELGWNVAVATISDIYASGGIPAYYGHSMSLNKNWDKNYLQNFMEGVRNVLEQTESYFIGGDLGFSENWHYTGIALGKSYRVLTRRGAKPGETIFMTGDAGLGNLAAALLIFSPGNEDTKLKLNIRFREAKLVAKYATSCIDSSDGVINALQEISEVNNTGFEITKPNINPVALAIAREMNIIPELLLFGECGEYELLFTVNNNSIENFLEEADKQNLIFTAIGTITYPSKKQLKTSFHTIDLKEFKIKGRDFSVETEYIAALINYLKKNGTSNFKNSIATNFGN